MKPLATTLLLALAATASASDDVKLSVHTFQDPGSRGMDSHTVLVPEGWKVEGGAFWANQRYFNVLPSQDVAVTAPDGRSVRVEPTMMAKDFIPPANLGMQRPQRGASDNGYPILPMPGDLPEWKRWYQDELIAMSVEGAERIRDARGPRRRSALALPVFGPRSRTAGGRSPNALALLEVLAASRDRSGRTRRSSSVRRGGTSSVFHRVTAPAAPEDADDLLDQNLIAALSEPGRRKDPMTMTATTAQTDSNAKVRDKYVARLRARLSRPKISVADARDGMLDCYVSTYHTGVEHGLKGILGVDASADQVAQVATKMFRDRLAKRGVSFEDPSVDALNDIKDELDDEFNFSELPAEIGATHDQVCSLLLAKADGLIEHKGDRSVVEDAKDRRGVAATQPGGKSESPRPQRSSLRPRRPQVRERRLSAAPR